MIRIPAFLKPGDRVALISPSRFAEPEQVAAAQAFTKAHGYELVEAPGLGGSDGQLGGTDADRAAQLNWALSEPSVRAVWGVRGGYGAVRAVDLVDWSLLHRDPKWLIGFSDFTVLLSESLQHRTAALHGPMAIQLARNATPETFQALADALRGAPWTLESPRAAEELRVRGPLVGGNLSVLYSLLGSPSFPDLRGCILALEDLDEYHCRRGCRRLQRPQGPRTTLRPHVVPNSSRGRSRADSRGRRLWIRTRKPQSYVYPRLDPRACRNFGACHTTPPPALNPSRTPFRLIPLCALWRRMPGGIGVLKPKG